MSLKDIVPVAGEVEYGGKSFEVHGLSLEDIVRLIDSHAPSLKSLFEGKATMLEVIADSPGFAAALIATAAGEPKNLKDAAKLPVGVQAIALQKIWELTAVDPETMGKLVRKVWENMEEFGGDLAFTGKTTVIRSKDGSDESNAQRNS